MEQKCGSSLNLLCHSMGNYVLKYATRPGNSSLRGLVFDNIGLVAADANNPGHETWVQCLPAKNRLYVVINENDSALKWSRRKPGDEQKERLGQHLRNLRPARAPVNGGSSERCRRLQRRRNTRMRLVGTSY